MSLDDITVLHCFGWWRYRLWSWCHHKFYIKGSVSSIYHRYIGHFFTFFLLKICFILFSLDGWLLSDDIQFLSSVRMCKLSRQGFLSIDGRQYLVPFKSLWYFIQSWWVIIEWWHSVWPLICSITATCKVKYQIQVFQQFSRILSTYLNWTDTKVYFQILTQ